MDGDHKIKQLAKNIMGGELQACCTDPMTGYFRDGYCNTIKQDFGTHVVCAIMTEEFLKFSKMRGNDLITPVPELNFPGLKPGDGWCLCASRWQQALECGVAPPIKPHSTHQKALEIIDLEDLMKHALN